MMLHTAPSFNVIDLANGWSSWLWIVASRYVWRSCQHQVANVRMSAQAELDHASVVCSEFGTAQGAARSESAFHSEMLACVILWSVR